MIKAIKKQYYLHKHFYRYLFISICVTILDIIISRICETLTKIIIANSIGIVAGFLVQFFLTSKYIYNNQKAKTFIKFALTFLLGFFLANGIVYICRVLFFKKSTSLIAFIISKGFSILIPFFVMYFIRKYWIKIET